MDNVSYCKTMGYGAAQKEGDPYTLYMYGKPADSDPEGIYRSTDCGKTWVLINQNHLYGGTGNGNYLVGDMNTFGTVYMSTVGCGIVVGKINGSEDPKPVTSSTTTTKQTTTTTTNTTTTTAKTTSDIATTSATDKATSTAESSVSATGTVSTTSVSATSGSVIAGSILYGDVNLDGRVDITDAVLLNKAVAGAVSLDSTAQKNADCDANNETGANDAILLLQFLVHIINSLPYTAE